ncbi:MAG: type II toxin-antitoxin system HicB family antitoxin [Burkholderiales bacterium]
MSNVMKYKDYFANIEYNAEDNIFVGRVQGIVDVLVFEGSSVEELKQQFKNTIDDYLDLCQRINKNPDKAFKGSFNVRIPPEMHKEAVRQAIKQGITLNEFVSRAIKEKIDQKQTMNINIQIEDRIIQPRVAGWEDMHLLIRNQDEIPFLGRFTHMRLKENNALDIIDKRPIY